MHLYKFRMIISAIVVLSLILSTGTHPTFAQQKITGSIELEYNQTMAPRLDPATGHEVSFSEATGTNRSTGDVSFMDGARVSNISYNDLEKGSGPHQGYTIMVNGNDTLISRWEGKMVTRFSQEGTPETTFEGDIWWVRTTGQLENMDGKGKYKGRLTGDKTYTVEWTGEHWPKK